MKTDEFKVIISVDADDAKKDIKDVKEETKELGKDGKKSMGEFDQAVADAKASISNSMKVVGVSIAAAATALVAISESTKEFRANQAKLNAAFESAGGSAKEAAQAYDGLYRVLGDDGQATEAAQHLAQLTTNQEDLAEWTDICQGVYATFGDSLPIESLTEASNETAKTGKITGALADALNWAGISEEQFQAELDKCVDASEREQKIRSTLNKTYKTASANYEKTAKDTLKANDAQNKMNKSLAKIGELIQPLITDFLEIGASILDGLQEPLEAAVGFIKDFVIPAIKGIVDFVKNNEGIILGAMAGITGAMITYKAAVLLAKGAEEGITIATMARTAAQKALNIVMNANPIGLATAAIVGITTAVVAYTTAADNAKESTTVLTQEQLELRDAVFEAAEAARTQREESQKAIGEIQSQSAYHKRLADELFKLADANGVVAESDRTRAQFIINQLNEAYGLEIEMIDGVIQNNNGGYTLVISNVNNTCNT